MATSAPLKITPAVNGDNLGRIIYASRTIAAKAMNAGTILIDLSMHSEPADLEAIVHAIEKTTTSLHELKANAASTGPKVALQAALQTAAEEVIVRLLSDEFGKFTDAYRVYLRESLAKGESPQVQAALNRARLQEKIIASTPMVDQSDACELLGLSKANASATMKRKEDRRELLRFNVDGRPSYPLFQFDVEGRRIYPAMSRLISAKPVVWSDFRLLHWLIRPHLDFDDTPAQSLGNIEAVTSAFEREIEPAVHG